MAFLNFIETFFFISLGITFVLVLLLVYHFKQRISGLEHKCDTMFEIINDIVKQLNTIRMQNNVPFMNVFNPMPKSMPEIQHFINETMNINENEYKNDIEEEDYDDAEEGDGSEEDEEESEEDEEESEDDEEESEDDEEESEDDEEESEYDHENDAEDEGSIKIINVNITESNEITELSVEELTDNNIENGENGENGENENEDEVEVLEPVNIEPISVEKIMPLDEADNADTNGETEINKKETEKEVYKKMSLSSLKTLVISKGLCSDASKLKKPDLLKLLENIED
jgi:hypothetical protein